MTTSTGGPAPRPQELAELALAASTADECVVLVRERSGANLRWAGNTLTTNGVVAGSSTTVVSFVRVRGGTATGSVTGPATTPDQVRRLVAAADAAATAPFLSRGVDVVVAEEPA